MSVDIRYITNGIKNCYYVRNSLEEGENIITIYDKKEEIPENIRHYASCYEPHYWGPDMARIMGCQKLLYPDFPKMCCHPDYVGKCCIAESCKYAPNGDWTRCPYFE